MTNALMYYLVMMTDMRRTMCSKKHKGQPPKGYSYYCFEDLVQDRGVHFTLSLPLNAYEREVLDTAAYHLEEFVQRQCYYNAQSLVLADTSQHLRYFEGYAQGNAYIPVLHAWVVLNGKVIDVTWRTEVETLDEFYADRLLGEIPKGWNYVGIEFTREELQDLWKRTKQSRSMIDNWWEGYPALKLERLKPVPEPKEEEPYA